MSDLRQAAQQALEALEALENTHDVDCEQTQTTITALRTALAEPVPAGWFEGPFGAFRANQLYKIVWPASTVAWSIPLYTEPPPQRAPLTDLEIWEMANQCTIAHDLHADKFARAIEAAHGITNQN